MYENTYIYVHLHICMVKPVLTAGRNKSTETIWRNDGKQQQVHNVHSFIIVVITAARVLGITSTNSEASWEGDSWAQV